MELSEVLNIYTESHRYVCGLWDGEGVLHKMELFKYPWKVAHSRSILLHPPIIKYMHAFHDLLFILKKSTFCLYCPNKE